MTRKKHGRASEAKTVRGGRRKRASMPESREVRPGPSQDVRAVARRKLRGAPLRGREAELFPLPESGPISPGNRCLAEIADLEERFAAGELTWHDYSNLLRELAPLSESS
jgi:hypothetical protein